MSADEAQLESLRDLSPQVSLLQDGNVTCVLMPKAKIATPAGVVELDVVLCPRGQAGYVTRLLLERRVEGKPTLNWQQVVVLGRTWHTWSWNNIPADQPWLKIYAEHARLLR